MKKLLFLCGLFLLLCSSVTKAQISFGAGTGFLKVKDMDDLMFGGGITGKYDINDNIRVGANLGFYTSSESASLLGETMTVSYSIMPITGSFEYSFIDGKFSPYAGLDLGIYSFSSSITFMGETESSSESELGFAPAVGFNYGLNDNLILNTNLKYHYILTEGESTTATGLFVGLVYKLGK